MDSKQNVDLNAVVFFYIWMAVWIQMLGIRSNVTVVNLIQTIK